MANNNDISSNRDGFTGHWGFILACIGSSVGLGNIWRFPVMVSTYGGLTFLVPFIIFHMLIGATGVIEEFSLGRAARSGPVGAFSWATAQRGHKKWGEILGFIPLVGALGLSIGYTIVVGWICKYVYLSLSGQLVAMGQNLDVIGSAFSSTAENSTIWIAVAILATFFIGIFGIKNGIEKANKIMMPLLFFLFLALSIYIFTLPGAIEGYRYIFSFNASGLADYRVWIFAFGQAFFSLSVAGNGSIIYGSYLEKNKCLPTAAMFVTIFDLLAAILATLVILPSMSASGEALKSGGPGLMFIYLVNVFNGIPGGLFVGIIFFICLLLASLSSIINLYEAPISFIQEKFKANRLLATSSILLIGAICASFIQPITSEWMDALSIYTCPLGAWLAGVMFYWVLDRRTAMNAVREGSKYDIESWFYPLGKYVYCLLAIVALIAGICLGGIG